MDLPSGVRLELLSPDQTVETVGGFQELDVDDGAVVLMHHDLGKTGSRAILLFRSEPRARLREQAVIWATVQPLRQWEASQDPLRPFWAAQSALRPAANLALAQATDDMLAGLRQASGVLPTWWSLGQAENGQGQRTDDLYLLTRAWAGIHAPVAIALVQAALSSQRGNGAIPRIVRPDGLHDDQWAPLPLLARSAWVAWQAEPNRSFYDEVMPRLQNYLLWAITYYDPEWRGLPIWRDAREAWTPETYNPLVATADLPSLLASELDAYRDLARAVPAGPVVEDDLIRYRASLGRTLSGFFWNKDATMFQDRFPAGDHVIRLTLSAALPLLDTTLARDSLQPVAERLARGGSLRDSNGVREWSPWPDDPAAPPIREDHQLLIMDALEGAGESEVAASLRQDLALRHTDEPLHRLEPAEAALRVVTLGRPAQHAQPFAMVSPLLTWLDAHRIGVMITTLGLLVSLFTGIVTSYFFKRTLTAQSAQTSFGLARRLYQEQQYDEARALLSEILDSGRKFPGVYLHLGNIEFRQGRWEAAEMAYRTELKRDPNAVSAELNLALVLLQQQRKQEALSIYAGITNRYAQPDPASARRAANAMRLLAEHPLPRLYADPHVEEKE
jgi:tetratricopeptide (TPR) repeat protein